MRTKGWWLLLIMVFAPVLAANAYDVSGHIVYEAKGPIGAFKGENTAVSGALSWDPGQQVASGRVCVDLTAWDSGEPLRDKHTRSMFETDVYPEACFELEGVRPAAAADAIVLEGRLTMHGVTLPLEIPGKLVQKPDGRLYFAGYFETRISDWGMKRPSMMGFKVRDLVKVWVYGEGVPR